MRHFIHLTDDERRRLFHQEPCEFARSSEPADLAVALGATLYLPATRRDIAGDLSRRAATGVTSMVLCLEDAIADDEVPAAEANTVEQLIRFAQDPVRTAAGPLVFVRVRRPDQITQIVRALGEHAGVLTGFVLPKFTDANGLGYLEALQDAEHTSGQRLFGMPVIESPEVIHRETRTSVLLGVRELITKHRESVLAVRIGATDLCSAFGIRRPPHRSIYDVRVVADVIADVVNILGRGDGSGFLITGPVWEYFSPTERVFRTQLRESPFLEHDAGDLREELLTKDIDGLLREVILDRANGLTGKTVIHPTHVAAVHALSVVTLEEWSDACDLLGGDGTGGARASGYGNKMNEAKPHRLWAQLTERRGRVFGVAAEDVSFVDLLSTGAPR